MPARAYVRKRSPGNDALNLHETAPATTFALLETEIVPERVWEPACGRGAMVRVLRAAGHRVHASDVRLWEPEFGQERHDFLRWHVPDRLRDWAIVTNPPFNAFDAFVAKAVRSSPWCAFLLPLAFLEGGVGRSPSAADRRFVLDERPPSRVHVFRRRLPMMHRDGWDGKRAGSGVAFAWFVWTRETFQGTLVDRIDYQGPSTQ